MMVQSLPGVVETKAFSTRENFCLALTYTVLQMTSRAYFFTCLVCFLVNEMFPEPVMVMPPYSAEALIFTCTL